MARRSAQQPPSTGSRRSAPRASSGHSGTRQSGPHRANREPWHPGTESRPSAPRAKSGQSDTRQSGYRRAGGGSERQPTGDSRSTSRDRSGHSGPRQSGPHHGHGKSERQPAGGDQSAARGRGGHSGVGKAAHDATGDQPEHLPPSSGAPVSRGRSGQSGSRQPGGRQSSARQSGPRHAHGEPERLQKVLSRAGLASRREAEDWIRSGRITINGKAAVLGARVVPSDQLRLDGRLIRQREMGSGAKAFVCHRSPGESLTQPNPESAAVAGDAPGTSLIERLPSRAGKRFITISPMPRVDGGLELVTSDGELGVKLQRSVRSLVSQFSVRVLGELSSQQLEGILGGILDSGQQLEVESCVSSGGEAANRWYAFVARGASGKDVRQLFERQGALVSRVQRTHLGPITMERSLGRGQFRELTEEELQALSPPGS